MNFKIRDARIEDKEEILSVIGSYPFKWDKRIAKRYYDDYFDESISLRGDKVFVLASGKKVVGVLGYSLDMYETKNYWLKWFYVHQGYQGKRFGTRLLNYVARRLRQKGVKKLFVETSSDAAYRNALLMYLDKGFRIEAAVTDYYSKGEDRIILSKTIAT